VKTKLEAIFRASEVALDLEEANAFLKHSIMTPLLATNPASATSFVQLADFYQVNLQFDHLIILNQTHR
jgi:hypothetical protein